MGSKEALNTTDFPENNQLPDEEDTQNEEYKVAGGKCSFHGVTYQLRLLMFFILKGLENNYSFKLATEMEAADKFDDVILRTNKESPSRGYVYRLLQAKHKGDKSSKNITANALISENLKGDFSLRAYLESYLKLRPKFTKGQDEIKDLIMCTNGKLKSKDSFGDITLGEAFEETDYVDDIFQVKLWKFSAEGRRVTKEFLKRPLNGKRHGEADIDSYLNKLHFAFDQYGNDDLEEQNKILLKRECGITNTRLAYPAFEKKINDWMTSFRGIYFSEVEARKFLQSLKDMVGRLIFDFRDPVGNFIGREEQLKEMDKAWKSDRHNIVEISGLGGMGKSELARKFIDKNSSVLQRIVWITADNKCSLVNTFHRLANRLGIDVKDKPTVTIVEEIYTFFGSKDSVFVFDNVERPETYEGTKHYIKDFFPVKLNSPLVIITSRWRWIWEDVFKISLEEMDQEDAEKFIKCNIHAKCKTSKDSITSLAKQLQKYPLALQQALAYIKHKCSVSYGENYSIENYLKDFKEEASQVLSCQVSSTSGSDYDKTSMTTWNITFNTIDKIDDKAAKILILLSHFAPDNINPNNIFFYFEETDKDKVKNSLFLLENFSVIGSNEENNIHVHRLIQKVKLLKLKETGKYEEALRWILISVHKIDLEHQISVWEKLDGYQHIQLEFSYLPYHAIHSLLQSFRYEQAYIFGKKSVRVLEGICRPTDINLLIATREFGLAAFLNMHKEEALTFYEKILKRVIIELCECNLITQRAQNSGVQTDDHIGNGYSDISCLKFGIPSCYLKSGNIIDALNLFVSVFQIEKFKKEKEILQERILVALNAITWIVRCHRDLGYKNKALILNEEVYEKEKLILGENHQRTLLTKYEIAMCHSKLGDNNKALMVLEELYDKEKEILGENHESTLGTKYAIAMCYSHLGDEIKISLKRGEDNEKRKEILGEKNKGTLGTKCEIAENHSELGDKTKALSLLEVVYGKQKETLGENHDSTLLIKHQIAKLHSDLRHKKKALMLLEEVYDKRKDIIGENHEHTLVTKYQIAMHHSDLGNKNKALVLLEGVYEKMKDILGERDARALETKYQIAMCLSELGDKKKALKLLEEVYKKRMDILRENHESTLVTKHQIAMCLSELGDKMKALMLLEEVYEKRKDILGENHENALETKYQIAMCHSELGDKTKALLLLEDIHEKIRNIFGGYHFKELRILEYIINLKGVN